MFNLSTSAPLASSSVATSVWPFHAALISAVVPIGKGERGSEQKKARKSGHQQEAQPVATHKSRIAP